MSEIIYTALTALEIVVGICQFEASEIYPSCESRKCHTQAVQPSLAVPLSAALKS